MLASLSKNRHVSFLLFLLASVPMSALAKVTARYCRAAEGITARNNMSTIIIVDDQPVNRTIYAKIASSICDDVRTRTFGDPREALEVLAGIAPDLIVTDYKMPGLNGASFIRRVRAEPGLADVPIIVITVFEDKAFRLRALDAGATDFLLSPVDHREFVTRARNLLKLRKQQMLLAHRAERLKRELQQSQQSLQQAVRDSSERLAQVIDAVPAMISATDQHGRFLFMNAYQAGLMGVDPSSVAGRDAVEILGTENGARCKAFDELVLRDSRSIDSIEVEMTDHTGEPRVFLTTKSPLKSTSNHTVGVVTSSLDITSRKAAERHLHYMAHHDSVTGLPNRIFLSERMRQEIARARRGDCRFALHLIDLDGFKGVNDVMGHSVGDQLLTVVAERLLTITGYGHVAARLGGDEFAVLQTNLLDNGGAAGLAVEICALLRKPVVLQGKRAAVTASIGTAIHPADGADYEELLRHADLAMYKAKTDGGDGHQFYAADMNVRALQAASLDADLCLAIERDEFVLHYQPQTRLDSGKTVGVEALVRWRKPDGSLVPPARFLPRAEENGLILTISELVLRKACEQAAAWRRAGLPVQRMSVNVSPSQFGRQGLPLRIAHILSETKLDPRLLELELTENILMHDVDQVIVQLQELSDLGVAISIDDFGTGFSSLSYVKRLPVDRVKVDQSFIRNIISDPSDRAIVTAIVNLAHSLRMDVVAEGVETIEQLEYVRSAGCDAVQGYYCGRPMAAAQFESFITVDRHVAATAVG
jgi:diguanylate cyclase (GGDEF)-like protein/PAS domain S-box-containing protein